MACDFIAKLSDVDNEYRPVPFWFINHYIREDVLRDQIREMSEKGFGGIMFHGRDGLRSGYLEKEWEDGITWSIDESEKLGMDVWLYDENHYPSGPAGGIVFRKHPERTMMSLVVLFEEEVRPGADVVFEISEDAGLRFALAFSSDGEVERLVIDQESSLFRWRNESEGEMTLMLLGVEREWPSPGQNFSFYPDYLDPEVSKEFIDLGYKWYVDRFKSKMGTTIKGIFTDNSCFNFGLIRRSVAWTPKLPERFKEETGLDLESVLPAVFCRIKGFEGKRQLFWRFLGDEYLRSFVHPIQTVCEENDIAATGHYCIEDGSSEHIRQIGDRYDLKRGQGLACTDMLGRKIGEDLFENTHQVCASMRCTADAAYYSNGSRVMCECLGLMGGWKLDLGEIKRVTGLLATQGIDLFVPHGLYYSIAGIRKWECTPDHYHNPMWSYYREWTDWISKISFLMAHSERTGEVALLHPSATYRSYIDLGAEITSANGVTASDRGMECDLADLTYRAAVNNFVKNNIEFDIVDEFILQQSEVKDGKLILKSGKGDDREISTVVLPACKVLDAKSIETLQRFQENGGWIITINTRVEGVYEIDENNFSPLSENAIIAGAFFEVASGDEDAFAEVVEAVRKHVSQQVTLSAGSSYIASRVWEKWNHTFFMLHNAAPETIRDIRVRLTSDSEPLLLDLKDDSLARIADLSGDSYEFTYDFSPGETIILVSGDDIRATGKTRNVRSENVTTSSVVGDWDFSTLKENVLPLRDGKVRCRDARQIHSFPFTVSEIPGKLKVVVDKEMTKSELLCNKYSNNLKCRVNGRLVENFMPGSYFDYFMFEADISEFVEKGDNEISIEYSASLLEQDRKCHVPFIIGDFRLVENEGEYFAIAAPLKSMTLGDWCGMGYPFYAGEASYTRTVALPENVSGKQLFLVLGDLSNAVEVVINGKSFGRRVLPPWEFNISSYRDEKELEVEIRIINTPQNIFCEELVPSGLFGPVEIITR